MSTIIDGKIVSAKVREDLKIQVMEFVKNTGVVPGLATVLVGDDPASHVYVKNKIKATEETGMKSLHFALPAAATEEQVLKLVDELNVDPLVHGILVQLPLPKQISTQKVLERIAPAKDVDGFHPYNVGRLTTGAPSLVSCTPYGVMKLLEHYGIDPAGKNAVVVGRSNIVGKPMALLLLNANATVTVVHSRTVDLKAHLKTADIVVAALGKAKFVKGEWLKQGCVVIDVGINRQENGKLCGDVDFESASAVASHITPVPGGVGPMTIAMLLVNTLTAAKGIL